MCGLLDSGKFFASSFEGIGVYNIPPYSTTTDFAAIPDLEPQAPCWWFPMKPPWTYPPYKLWSPPKALASVSHPVVLTLFNDGDQNAYLFSVADALSAYSFDVACYPVTAERSRQNRSSTTVGRSRWIHWRHHGLFELKVHGMTFLDPAEMEADTSSTWLKCDRELVITLDNAAEDDWDDAHPVLFDDRSGCLVIPVIREGFERSCVVLDFA